MGGEKQMLVGCGGVAGWAGLVQEAAVVVVVVIVMVVVVVAVVVVGKCKRK